VKGGVRGGGGVWARGGGGHSGSLGGVKGGGGSQP